MKKLLIANRGEIAVRVIRAARELDIATVAVYSSADKTSLAVQLADEAVEIGPPAAKDSYLKVDAVIDAAKQTGADAIHPGYGFLAENADFAEKCAAAGITFVGPDAKLIRLMGDKAQARDTAIKAGVPVVPGSDGVITELAVAVAEAERIGYPLMIKASAGGGGKGIRVVPSAEEFSDAFTAAQREGLGAFGDNGMYLERFIEKARHIEVQILGDGDNAVHLFDRECSLQRRRQKILEEAPSPSLDDASRDALCQSACDLAKSIGYKGAGTMEYLYDEDSNAFYFIEMNTRIQVEHAITEMVTGIDLIREMLHIADGKPLRFAQSDIRLNGASIECRINAENPQMNFMPNIGTIETLQWGSGFGTRVDSMLYSGYTVPPFYDSMLAKMIVWDENRDLAFKRLQRMLAETTITGLATTLPLHRKLAEDTDVLAGRFHTNWLEQWMEQQTWET